MGRPFLLLTTFLIMSFTDVAHASENIDLNTQKVSRGKILYDLFCASCHGPFEKTTKPQRSTNRLRSAIEQFPAMRKLDFLDDESLEAIAAALATIPY